MRKLKTGTLVLLGCQALFAQAQISPDEGFRMAERNYPLIERYELIEASRRYDLSNASKGYLPQLSLSARATYQSDVTSLPVSLPGVEVPTLSKKQVQIVAEATQSIWDGGDIRSRKNLLDAQYETQRWQNATDLYALRDRVNNLYFGILLLDRQIELNRVYTAELRSHVEKVEAYIRNGVANSADLDAVRVELVSANQKNTELTTLRDAYFKMLSALVGEKISESSQLQSLDRLAEEAMDYLANGSFEVDRPELSLFEAMKEQAAAREGTVKAANRPRFDAFVQGGYGNPGLNMLKNEYTPYALGGLRLVWNIGSLYTRKNNLRLINTQKKEIDLQQDAFLFNNDLQIDEVTAEIVKFRELAREDELIIRLRENIRRSAEAQTEYGTMSVLDYMREVQAEQGARVNQSVHTVQLLKSIYELKYLTNN